MSATRPRLKLRDLLLAVNLTVLWLPLLGLEALRLYDSALVRQTESELLAQAAFLAAGYRAALLRLAPQAASDPAYGLPLADAWRALHDRELRWRPRPARLDLAEDVMYPPPPEPIDPGVPPDAHAVAVGRELQALLNDVQVVTLAGMAVVDAGGVVVASTGPSAGRSLLAFEEVRRALTGEPVSLLRQRIADAPAPAIDSISRGTPLRVFVAAPILHEQRIVAAVLLWRTPIALSQVLHGKRYHLLLAALLLLATVALMSLLTALTVLRPLRALVQQARRAGAGETGAVQPLVRPVTREIAELSQAVSSMAQHLEQRADYIRAFAAHVSHEFKTPLAAMRGALELLRDHAETMTVAERERFLGNLDQDAARLERLVRRLLELARADVLQASVSDRAELAAVVRRMAERYAAPGFTVIVPEPLPGLEVAISEDALESILSNLLDNARQHGADTLTLHCSSRAALACIEISDNGPGISAANAARVFEPFFTTARARGGTGLGLAVVRALLKAYRGRIELLGGGPGTRLRIELPLASSSR